MKKSLGLCIALVVVLISGCSQPAATSDQTTLDSFTKAPVPGDDAPELAHLGEFPVGVQTFEYVYADQPEISLLGHGTGYEATAERRLTVDILYPANVDLGVPSDAVYHGIYATGLTEVQGLPERFEVRGIAVRDAEPVSGQRFPLVIFSHGYFTTPGVMSGITENLASKGYVVASIDHHDQGSDSDTPVHRFARTLLNRSVDQQRVYKEMLSLSQRDESALGNILDPTNVALVGFSMGGYGVLHHAGAGFDENGSAFDIVPGDLLAEQLESSVSLVGQDRQHIKAVIGLAPWGGVEGQAWTDSALANVSAPTLLLTGDQDDVSDYENGIARVFEKMTGSDRYMLVFQNARHNIAQVPAPPSAHLDVVPWQTFEEPIWRRDRLLAVGNHFMTAFLDLHLKQNESRRAYLELPTVLANEATWEQPFASDYSDRYADGTDGSEYYWRGFKRRQAIGLELHHLEN